MHAKLLFKQFLSAIEYMHRHGVCHRDLKPHNILCLKGNLIMTKLQDLNTIKITDFNVSKFSDYHKGFGDLKDYEKIEMWTYTGTVAFSAPEIFTGEGYTYTINPISDKWSTCGVLDAYCTLCYQANSHSMRISTK
jgi:calcium/calmodulin-dependent protein kinase I